jgi:hypothetical protein
MLLVKSSSRHCRSSRINALEQGLPALEVCGDNILVQYLLQQMMHGHLVLLAAFFVQSQPPARAVMIVIINFEFSSMMWFIPTAIVNSRRTIRCLSLPMDYLKWRDLAETSMTIGACFSCTMDAQRIGVSRIRVAQFAFLQIRKQVKGRSKKRDLTVFQC